MGLICEDELSEISCRSSLVGVATGQEEIKYSSKARGSVRNITFMYTERLVPVDEPPGGDDDVPQPPVPEDQGSTVKSAEGLESNPPEDENTEVCTM